MFYIRDLHVHQIKRALYKVGSGPTSLFESLLCRHLYCSASKMNTFILSCTALLRLGKYWKMSLSHFCCICENLHGRVSAVASQLLWHSSLHRLTLGHLQKKYPWHKYTTVLAHMKETFFAFVFLFLKYCPIEISPMGNLDCFCWGKPAATVVLPNLRHILGVLVFP